jgi:hypothetical protein
MICGSVADDPEVKEAFANWDRATPSTHRELVRARLAAQERAGVAEADRAPLYASEVESYLLPIIMQMGRNDESATLASLRRDLRHLTANMPSRCSRLCCAATETTAPIGFWRRQEQRPRRRREHGGRASGNAPDVARPRRRSAAALNQCRWFIFDGVSDIRELPLPAWAISTLPLAALSNPDRLPLSAVFPSVRNSAATASPSNSAPATSSAAMNSAGAGTPQSTHAERRSAMTVRCDLGFTNHRLSDSW